MRALVRARGSRGLGGRRDGDVVRGRVERTAACGASGGLGDSERVEQGLREIDRERGRESRRGVNGEDLATGICNELDTQGSRGDGTRGAGRARGDRRRNGGEGCTERRGEGGEPGVAQELLDHVRHPTRAAPVDSLD